MLFRSKISFAHPAINKKLCTYLKAKRLQENIKNNKYNFDSQEQQEEALAAISADMEEIKSHLLDDSMIVKKGTHGLSVKMFP